MLVFNKCNYTYEIKHYIQMRPTALEFRLGKQLRRCVLLHFYLPCTQCSYCVFLFAVCVVRECSVIYDRRRNKHKHMTTEK